VPKPNRDVVNAFSERYLHKAIALDVKTSDTSSKTARQRLRGPELQGMKPEGESIKPDDKNEDGSKGCPDT